MQCRVRSTSVASVAVILLMALILPAVALAQSYYSSLGVYAKSTYSGASRSYTSGGNMHITCETYSAAGGYYKVKLVRDRTFPLSDVTIGSVDMLRNGHGYGNWSSVGNGNYHFYFDNSTGSSRIDCAADDVHMWSN